MSGQDGSEYTLKRLKALDKKSKGKLLVNISYNLKFHWKYYGFEKVTNIVSFIGSANFTNSGLEGPGELTTKLTSLKSRKSEYQSISKMFNDEWDNSFSISKFPVDLYISSSLDIASVSGKFHPSILNLFKRKLLSKLKQTSNEVLPKIITKLTGDLSTSTTKLISTTKSHWDKNGWDYFVCFKKQEYDKFAAAEYIAVIERYAGKYIFFISQIQDSTMLSTVDGNYFIAHKAITRVKKESVYVRAEFSKLAINYRSRIFSTKPLSKKQSIAIKTLFLPEKVISNNKS